MFLEQDVKETNNTYISFLSVLELCNHLQIEEIYTPLICNGCGNVSIDKSLAQMEKALNDYKNKEIDIFGLLNGYYYNFPNFYNLKKNIKEQPENKENKEFYKSNNINDIYKLSDIYSKIF